MTVKQPWYKQCIYLLLVFILVYTATDKVLNLTTYKAAMRAQPLSEWITTPLTYTLPTLEFIAATCLIIPILRSTGTWLTLILMMIFTIYVAYILLAGLHKTTCPCGGLFTNLDWNMHLLINGILTAITIYILERKKSTTNIFPGHGKRRNADASEQTK